ncbi:MAG: alpha/beta fold hydrolase, partial [Actinomycetota bacterium]
MDHPETRFARSGDLHIAYQSFGEGPIDIMHVSNWTWAVDLVWDHPLVSAWLTKLGKLGRVVQFDMPGTGSSDPLPGDRPITLEEWMDTVAVVLDDAHVERAALVAQDVGGMMAMLFAAAHPERVSSLILISTTARLQGAPGYPGFPEELREQGVDWWVKTWGTGHALQLWAPSIAEDREMRELQGRYERLTLPPATAERVFSLVSVLDVRHLLETIHVPTLVLHRRSDRWIPVAQARYLADHIPDARYVELPGDDHMPFAGDVDLLASEIREFLGVMAQQPQEESDRALATVLFTDIVSSTERAAEIGDR